MRKAILMCAVLALCGAAQVEQPKQEQKAQPAKPMSLISQCSDCVLTQPLPFDLPAKEWDGPEQVAEDTCGDMKGAVGCTLPYIPVPVHHVSCKGVAPDWKKRVLLQTADGREHCYALYLLSGPRP